MLNMRSAGRQYLSYIDEASPSSLDSRSASFVFDFVYQTYPMYFQLALNTLRYHIGLLTLNYWKGFSSPSSFSFSFYVFHSNNVFLAFSRIKYTKPVSYGHFCCFRFAKLDSRDYSSLDIRIKQVNCQSERIISCKSSCSKLGKRYAECRI